ncbi:MAG: glycerate kinase [Woeseiaceae bacterium]|nr:glycerate kinase [Woeseiaceae bacterium]
MDNRLGIDGHRDMLEQLFRVGVDHCLPRNVLPQLLPTASPRGRNIVLGAGKASAEMAAVANDTLKGTTVGLVVTRHGHGASSSTGDIEVVEAGHPVPDSCSFEAAEKMLALAETATADDRVLFMFSGGGSALLCAPVDGVSAERKQEITRFLLHSGARIDEINCVRKHLSRIKGGALAHRAARAELMTFVISDVVGDNPSDIASGPSVPYQRDVSKATGILEKYGYADVGLVVGAISKAEQFDAPEHPIHIAATAQTALDSIASEVEAAGWKPVSAGQDLEGDATQMGKAHAELALRYRNQGERVALISGGELTVQVSNRDGHGGPNLEYLASLMLSLDGADGIEALACDSDGIDGSEDNAGGYVSPSSLRRASDRRLVVEELLSNNDTYTCFESLGDLIMTGPTRTNINDIRIILVDPNARSGSHA